MPRLQSPKPGARIPPPRYWGSGPRSGGVCPRSAGARDPDGGAPHPPVLLRRCCPSRPLPCSAGRGLAAGSGCSGGGLGAGAGAAGGESPLAAVREAGRGGWEGCLFLCFEPVVAAACGGGEWVAESCGPLPAPAPPALRGGTRLPWGDPTGATLSSPGLILCVLPWGPARSVGVSCQWDWSRARGLAGRWGRREQVEAGNWGPSCHRRFFPLGTPAVS